MSGNAGPVVIEVDGTQAEVSPAAAPPIDDLPEATRGAAMARAAAIAARPSSPVPGMLLKAGGALFTFVLGLAAWDYVTDLLARSPILGGIAAALIGVFTLILLVAAARELAALWRLDRLDGVRAEAEAAVASGDLAQARKVADHVAGLYKGRPDVDWGRARLEARRDDVLDADGLLALVEDDILAPLDAQASRVVEAAARQVATVTAVVPLALADVVTALASSLRMIRQIAEIYGGRSGTLGAWRLTRAVMTHLVATGAVAVGDDLIGSVAGGGVLAKVSRRFGEGVVNGALTARVGVAAIEVCRPLPFTTRSRPSVSAIVGRALTGLFGQKD